MPQLIEHIDAIARKKQRDVLYISFESTEESKGPSEILEDFEAPCKEWKTFKHRQELIEWLQQNGIDWQPCGPVCRPGCFGPYEGDIYLDVPFDVADKSFQLLQQHLENSDETMRIRGVNFCYYPLKAAMKNAHHDDPDYDFGF